MSFFLRLSISLLTCAVTMTAVDAFGGRHGSVVSRGYSYYYAAPSYYYSPCWPGPVVMPVFEVRPIYATPMPAPPSGGEPPLGKGESRAPKITTVHSGAGDSSKTCRVGFWNLTGREVTLLIEGKTWTLPKNQVLNFQIERQFTWQIVGQTPHLARVPEGQAAHEVIVRE